MSGFSLRWAVCLMVTMTTLLAPVTWGLRVLLVPANIGSHYIMFQRFGEALVSEGHEVSLVAASNAPVLSKLQRSPLDVHVYEGVGPAPVANSVIVSELFLKLKFTQSKWQHIQLYREADAELADDIRGECLNMLRNTVVRQRLQELTFDLAVGDFLGSPCTLNLPILLGLPFAVFNIPAMPWLYRVPDLPSSVPNSILSDLTDRMSFPQRLENVGLWLLCELMMNLTNIGDVREFPELAGYQNVENLMAKAKFWFLMEDISLAYPRSGMPNTEAVGDIMIPVAGNLSKEFQQFMDDSPEGVILFSFGSYFDHVPPDVLEKFCWALSRVEQKVIWKTKVTWPCGSPDDYPLVRRLKVVRWMPQSDLLAHDNLRLFITHGGLNSAVESLYHGKPMIVCPIALDQPFNAKLIQAKGYGQAIDIADFTAEQFLDTVQQTLDNASVIASLRKGSAILRDKVMPVSQRIAFWLEHVVKYGDSHLRTAAFDLNIIQFYMVDIFFFFMGVLVVAVIVLIMLLYCTCRCVNKCCRYCYRENRKTKSD